MWWEEQAQHYKLFYSCGSYEDTGMTCVCTSKDGISWDKVHINSRGRVPPASADEQVNLVAGANKSAMCNTVWLDRETNSYRIAETHPTGPEWTTSYLGQYRLYSGGSDGYNWSLASTPPGLAGDRSTMYYDPFRSKWVFSLKYTTGDMKPQAHPPVWVDGAGRSRAYWDADELFAPAPWPTGNGSGTQNGRNAAGVPGFPNFAHTDSADPMLYLNSTSGSPVFSDYLPNLCKPHTPTSAMLLCSRPRMSI